LHASADNVSVNETDCLLPRSRPETKPAQLLLGSWEDTHMLMIKAIAFVSGIGAVAILLLDWVAPDTILAIVCCFT